MRNLRLAALILLALMILSTVVPAIPTDVMAPTTGAVLGALWGRFQPFFLVLLAVLAWKLFRRKRGSAKGGRK